MVNRHYLLEWPCCWFLSSSVIFSLGGKKAPAGPLPCIHGRAYTKQGIIPKEKIMPYPGSRRKPAAGIIPCGMFLNQSRDNRQGLYQDYA